MTRFALTYLLVIVTLLFATGSAEAVTYHVATSGNDLNPGTQAQPFRTIAKGVAAAADGDSVLVAAGTYAERVAWSAKALVLQGAGARLSIIDGSATGTCVTLTGVPSACRVAGFTLRNGAASAGSAGGLTSNGDGSPTVVGCTFSNHAGTGTTGLGAFTSNSGNPTLVNCTFSNNTVSAIMMSGGSLTVNRCTFTNNRGYYGGAMDLENGYVFAIHCLMLNNSSSTFDCQVGQKFSRLDLTCSLIADSVVHPSFYFAVEAQFGCATYLTNCTIAGSKTVLRFQQNSYLEMTNSILWGTVPQNSGVSLVTGSTAMISYSDVVGGTTGPGNISVDPQFMDVATGNYRLQSTSPCRDTGNVFSPFPIADLDGAPRIIGSAPDRGAYEFWISASGSWFVDKALGNDTTGAGSPGAPYKTVVKAITVASPTHSIYIKAGNYGSDRPRITKSLRLYNWLSTGSASIGKP